MEQKPEAFHRSGGYPALRRLWPADAIALRDHLLRLSPDLAPDATELTRRIQDHDWSDTLIIGAFEGDALRGLVEFTPGPDAKLAISVEEQSCNRGLGTQLLDRAMVMARNHGASFVTMICLPGNSNLLHTAIRLGAVPLSQATGATTTDTYLSCLTGTGINSAMLELDGARLIA